MAEFVGYRMECALPEYEQMKTLNLFSPEEITKMKKARENFEYRCTQPSRKIGDFVEYIKYERSVIGLTKQRTKQNKSNKNHTIVALISNRMKQLYAQGLSKFPSIVRFWDEYVKFLQQFKFTKDIPSTFDRMLQFHSDKPDVWIRAILWEYNENYSDERVKGLLLRAQQLHSDSPKLYLTFFQIELENKREADEQLALQHANIVYANGKKKFTNATFFIEMLEIVDKFSYANSIQQLILQDLREMFKHEEIMWHTLAQRELIGIPTEKCFERVKMENENEPKNEEEIRHDQQSSLRRRIEQGEEVYKQAVECANIKDKTKMWNYYINAMLKLNNDLSNQKRPIDGIARFALSKAFEGALKSNHMSEHHYLQYIELLYSNNSKDENIEHVFQKATKFHDKSENIWLQYLRYYIQGRKIKQLKEMFKTAKTRLGTNGSKIWELYLNYLRTLHNNEANAEFDSLVKEVASLPYFNLLKANILELIATTISMNRARKTYQLFINHCPSTYEVHEMMAELEQKQLKRDVDSERRCMEMLILNFGKTRTDVWLRYMRFERNVGDPKNVSRLHQNALATLNPGLLDEFSQMYTFFSNGDV